MSDEITIKDETKSERSKVRFVSEIDTATCAIDVAVRDGRVKPAALHGRDDIRYSDVAAVHVPMLVAYGVQSVLGDLTKETGTAEDVEGMVRVVEQFIAALKDGSAINWPVPQRRTAAGPETDDLFVALRDLIKGPDYPVAEFVANYGFGATKTLTKSQKEARAKANKCAPVVEYIAKLEAARKIKRASSEVDLSDL